MNSRIPSEIIREICTFLSNIKDLFAYSLVSKRFYSATLKGIREPTHQSRSLLSGFLTETLRIWGTAHDQVPHIGVELMQVLGFQDRPHGISIRVSRNHDRHIHSNITKLFAMHGAVNVTNNPQLIALVKEIIETNGILPDKIRHYWFGKYHGLEIDYHYTNSKRIEREWVNDELHGDETTYSLATNSMIEHKTSKNGKSQGAHTWCFDNGQIERRRHFLDDALHGEEEDYIQDHPFPVMRRRYSFGNLEGKEEVWWPDSLVLKSISHYSGESWRRPCGVWEEYYQTGVIKERIIYDDSGKLLGRYSFPEHRNQHIQ